MISKNKAYSFINIVGLAFGLAVCFLITLFVLDELSYDKYNLKANRIYRVTQSIEINGTNYSGQQTPVPLAPALERDFPQIEKAVRVMGIGSHLVKKGNETFMQKNFFQADPSFFQVFTLHFIVGNPVTALSQPKSLVISESNALKFFNTVNVIGKTLKIDDSVVYQVTGVFKDVPSQSHLHFEFIATTIGEPAMKQTSWLSLSFSTYVLLRPGVSGNHLQNFLNQSVLKYTNPEIQIALKTDMKSFGKNGSYWNFSAMPLLKIHLTSPQTTELEPSGSIQYIYIFSIVAIFILLIACVNFVNLSTARAGKRSKEVGVRKVLGSNRKELINQFLFESVLSACIAFFVALIIAFCLVPLLNTISGKSISIVQNSSIWIILSLIVVTIFVGLIAGSYPAFYLSSFNPVLVLKGKLVSGSGMGLFRNSLVIFQFTTAIILIVGTLGINSQLNFIRSKRAGYNREQLLIVTNISALFHDIQAFKAEVLSIPGVVSATRADVFPTSPSASWNTSGFSKNPEVNAVGSMLLTNWSIDDNYFPALGMKLAQGRNFSSHIASDSTSIVINETAVHSLGFKDPLKSRLYLALPTKSVPLRIIGVVKDFNAGSMRYKTPPIIFTYGQMAGSLCFKIRSENIPGVISKIQKSYHSFTGMTGQPFLYSFMDEDFNKLYESDERTATIFLSFAIFAILIACLGLFGLISYAAEQRTKEIGIRKVLGATVSSILSLLSVDFFKLVLLASVIAFPIGWYGINKWLENFAYRTSIGWWIFATAGVIALLITAITTSFQAIKAAMANPVTSLRSE